MTDGSPPDVVFEGDSRAVIKSFPENVREDLGADLWRVQNGEKPLDSGPMAPALPGVFELRDPDFPRHIISWQQGVVKEWQL